MSTIPSPEADWKKLSASMEIRRERYLERQNA